MSQRTLIIGAVTLAWAASLSASSRKASTIGQIRAEPDTVWAREVSPRSAAPLRIENVRLEAAPRTETAPSAMVKFDAVNSSSKRLTDLFLEIPITGKPVAREPGLTPGRLLVRPFQVRGNFVLESGYTINYEMLLRHFSSDCDCVANVDVLSVRSLPDSR